MMKCYGCNEEIVVCEKAVGHLTIKAEDGTVIEERKYCPNCYKELKYKVLSQKVKIDVTKGIPW